MWCVFVKFSNETICAKILIYGCRKLLDDESLRGTDRKFLLVYQFHNTSDWLSDVYSHHVRQFLISKSHQSMGHSSLILSRSNSSILLWFCFCSQFDISSHHRWIKWKFSIDHRAILLVMLFLHHQSSSIDEWFFLLLHLPAARHPESLNNDPMTNHHFLVISPSPRSET